MGSTLDVRVYQTIFKNKLLLMVLVTFFVSDNLDNIVPDHNFLFPEFEIVIETEDEITPEVVETDESEITGSMGKESIQNFVHEVIKHSAQKKGLSMSREVLRGKLNPLWKLWYRYTIC